MIKPLGNLSRLNRMESPCPGCGGERVSHYKHDPLRWRCLRCGRTGWIHKGER